MACSWVSPTASVIPIRYARQLSLSNSGPSASPKRPCHTCQLPSLYSPIMARFCVYVIECDICFKICPSETKYRICHFILDFHLRCVSVESFQSCHLFQNKNLLILFSIHEICVCISTTLNSQWPFFMSVWSVFQVSELHVIYLHVGCLTAHSLQVQLTQ